MSEYLSWCIFGVAVSLTIAILGVVGMNNAKQETIQALSKGCSVITSQYICPGLTK